MNFLPELLAAPNQFLTALDILRSPRKLDLLVDFGSKPFRGPFEQVVLFSVLRVHGKFKQANSPK
jgi:hypothetical protein